MITRKDKEQYSPRTISSLVGNKEKPFEPSLSERAEAVGEVYKSYLEQTEQERTPVLPRSRMLNENVQPYKPEQKAELLKKAQKANAIGQGLGALFQGIAVAKGADVAPVGNDLGLMALDELARLDENWAAELIRARNESSRNKEINISTQQREDMYLDEQSRIDQRIQQENMEWNRRFQKEMEAQEKQFEKATAADLARAAYEYGVDPELIAGIGTPDGNAAVRRQLAILAAEEREFNRNMEREELQLRKTLNNARVKEAMQKLQEKGSYSAEQIETMSKGLGWIDQRLMEIKANLDDLDYEGDMESLRAEAKHLRELIKNPDYKSLLIYAGRYDDMQQSGEGQAPEQGETEVAPDMDQQSMIQSTKKAIFDISKMTPSDKKASVKVLKGQLRSWIKKNYPDWSDKQTSDYINKALVIWGLPSDLSEITE